MRCWPVADHEQDPAPFQVRSDRPVEFHNPIRRARLLAVLVVAAIILSSFAAGFVGYRLADASMNRRVSALEADRAKVTQMRTDQINQLRAAACVILDRLPQDPTVDQQRALYGCGPYVQRPGGAPIPAPSGARPNGSGGRTPAGGSAPGQSVQPAPPVQRPTPGPVPAPSPTPGPAPTKHTLCLPILGCLL